MSHSLLWMQCGGCCGDTWSFFNAQSPDAIEFFQRMACGELPSVVT